MIRKVFKHTHRQLALIALIFLSTLVLTACGGGGGGGSDSYDEPKSVTSDPIKGAATSVLIDAATLKSWLDAGLVNNDNGFDEKVVIIEYATTGDHIEGAVQVGVNDLRATRLDGLAPHASLVAPGAQIDAVIQAAGIDENTTIVFMTGGSGYLASRAYWTFRYWGFPMDRLKVLDGGKAAWTAAGYELVSTATEVAASTYSVQDLGAINDDLRVSISELINVVSDSSLVNGTDYLTIDARGAADPSGYLGTAATSSLDAAGTYVVFEGHPADGIAYGQAALFDANGGYLEASQIRQNFIDAGWVEGTPVITYCTSGYSCTPIFFAFEAMLGADIQVFDGSWSQAGQYAAITTDADGDGIDDITGAVLPSDSPWDLTAFIDDLGYNVDNGKDLSTIYTMPYSADLESWYYPGDEETNQVETTDSDYASSGTSDGSAPTPGSDAGDVDC
jgi:3-mercaptopyruvate sulfurtransferase SseA